MTSGWNCWKHALIRWPAVSVEMPMMLQNPFWRLGPQAKAFMPVHRRCLNNPVELLNQLRSLVLSTLVRTEHKQVGCEIPTFHQGSENWMTASCYKTSDHLNPNCASHLITSVCGSPTHLSFRREARLGSSPYRSLHRPCSHLTHSPRSLSPQKKMKFHLIQSLTRKSPQSLHFSPPTSANVQLWECQVQVRPASPSQAGHTVGTRGAVTPRGKYIKTEASPFAMWCPISCLSRIEILQDWAAHVKIVTFSKWLVMHCTSSRLQPPKQSISRKYIVASAVVSALVRRCPVTYEKAGKKQQDFVQWCSISPADHPIFGPTHFQETKSQSIQWQESSLAFCRNRCFVSTRHAFYKTHVWVGRHTQPFNSLTVSKASRSKGVRRPTSCTCQSVR